ncbi:hypothetical protein PSPO01_11343 [Paraphaeosphaeria sporulosa]
MDWAGPRLREYEDRPLNADAEEIRLIRLLPGDFNDDLEVKIFHALFVEPEPAKDTRLGLDEIRKTLPHPWTVWETKEGRYIYSNDSENVSKWTHPDPKLDEELFGNGKSFEMYPNFEPRYESLSYVWGTEEAKSKVHVVHDSLMDVPSLIYVRSNLYNALKYLRDPLMERVLWVDAICVNQADVRERNREVANMARIYTFASRTIIWLGLEDESGASKRAFEILGFIGEQFETTTERGIFVTPGFKNRSASDTAFPSAYVHLRSLLSVTCDRTEQVGPIYSNSDWEAIEEILTRSWWDRLWIWQEARLGYRKAIVQCGPGTIPWSSLAHSTAAFSLSGNLIFGASFNASLVAQRRHLFAGGKWEDDIEHLLVGTQKAQYTDEHDRIYALLGLVSPRFRANIAIDYSRNVFDLFYDTCVAMINASGGVFFSPFLQLGP